jgi:transcription antitermination factor NusG
MPILAAEPTILPGDLITVANDRLKAGEQWWVMHTLARQEKELTRRLRAMQIAHYCPLVKRRTKSAAGRIRVSHVPLFSSYVFVLGDEAARYKTLTTKCVAQCLSVIDSPQLTFDLSQIKRLIDCDAPLTPEARLQPGSRVRIRSGPMMGLEGTITKRRGKDWLVVALAFLQQGASVLMEDYQVEAI